MTFGIMGQVLQKRAELKEKGYLNPSSAPEHISAAKIVAA